MKTALIVVIALLLGGCTHAPPMEGETVQLEDLPIQLHFAVVHNRYLEMEPCGCSLGPMGGVDREWNLLRKWKETLKGSTLYVSAGTTFVKEPSRFEKKHLATYRKKSEFMVDSLNRLGVDVISPTAEDFALGEQWLMELRKKAKFRMVSANLKADGKLKFPAYVLYRYPDIELVLTGISAPANTVYPTGDVEVADPLDSLNAVLASLPPGPKRMVVVLSQLGKKQRQELQKRLRFPSIFLGSDNDGFTRQLLQFNGDQLHLAPLSRGRQVGRLSLTLTPSNGGFYVPENTPVIEGTRQRIQTMLADKSLDSQRRQTLTKQLETLDRIPLKPAGRFHTVESELVLLDGKWVAPANPLTEVLKKMHQAVRTQALEASAKSDPKRRR